MSRFLAVVACLGLLGLTLPAVAQVPVDQVYPGQEDPTGLPIGDIKASYLHLPDGTSRPADLDHDGNTADNRNPMPWYWHPAEDVANVAGVRFTIHYDSYEAAILGINPAGGVVNGPFIGPHNFDPPPPPPESQGESSARVQGTVWVDHDVARLSGIPLPASEPVQLFSLAYQPRHTSEASNPLYNSDVDIRVTQITPIYHVGVNTVTGSFWRYNSVDNTLQHVASTPGVWVPNSQEYVPGPLLSDSAPQITHVQNNIHIPSSAYAHADRSSVTLPTAAGFHVYHWTLLPNTVDSEIRIPPSQVVHLLGSQTLTGQLIRPSSFVVGNPVVDDAAGLGKTFGLGIDHVPEPTALVLLCMGGLALLMQTWIRRRRHAA